MPCLLYITVRSLNLPFPYFNSTLPSGFHKCIKASRSHQVNSVEAGGQTKWPLLRGSSHPLDHKFQFRSPIKSIRCSFGSKFICLSESLFTVNKSNSHLFSLLITQKSGHVLNSYCHVHMYNLFLVLCLNHVSNQSVRHEKYQVSPRQDIKSLTESYS